MKQTVVFLTAVLISIICIIPPAQAERIGIDAGIEYRSEYFWRGFSFYGGDTNNPRGVYFPWIGFGFSDFYFSVSGEVASARVADNQPNNVERGWYGIDYILDFNKKLFSESITLGIRAAYFMYPNSPDINEEVNGEGKDWRNDFAEAAASITVNALPLNPKILVSYYYRIDDRDGTQENAEDVYAQFSVSHTFAIAQNASLKLHASIAYFNYASSEQWNSPEVGGYGDDYRGISDITIGMKLSVSADSGVTVFGSWNYAYVPDEDFYMANWYKEKHHYWTTFGVTYSI